MPQVDDRPVNTCGVVWHFAHTSEVCAPVSRKLVLEWSKLAGSHALVVWQVEQIEPKTAVCEAGRLWHEAQMVGAPANVVVGEAWHRRHVTDRWAPVSL